MSQSQTLRDLVNDRLSAAAEDIIALFMGTIVEYEEQLRLYKEENQRKQGLLDSALAAIGGPQIHSFFPGNEPENQRIQETPMQIKDEPEEQGMKQESGPQSVLTVPVPEPSVCVTKESSLFHPRQTPREDTGAVAQPGLISNTEDWESPFRWSAAVMEPEANGLHYNHVQIRGSAALTSRLSCKYTSAPETDATGNNGDMSETNQAIDKPFSCSICNKTFTRKSTLKLHARTHTGERLFSCLTCQKRFTRKSSLESHKKIHTGEKPFSCSTCKQTFLQKSAFKRHMKTHKHLICKHLSQHVPLQ